jgi:hypothetical protein
MEFLVEFEISIPMALRLYDWMHITVTALEPHRNDPGIRSVTTSAHGSER